MEVSQAERAKTHAVMGGEEAEAFGMSQSAEFFTVLSSTLYRDKKRAVVRETICNAWDAHIASGRTNTPVEVTITREEMIIQDSGYGIKHEMIRTNYCVYGNSTKASDNSQTGGFGLGSKAPFAYSDHFSVESCHEGTKSVYAISRGGVETKGIPDLRRMVSVPTKNSGLKVTIPIKNEEDRRDFVKIVKSVAYQGGMNVHLNDEKISVIDYTLANKSGFLLTGSDGLSESEIYVLYGTVLYPISSTERRIQNIGSKLVRMVPEYMTTILIAQPGTIGITPSRESLSYTQATMDELEILTDRVISRIKKEIPSAKNEFIEGLVKKSGRYSLQDICENAGRNFGRNGYYISPKVVESVSTPKEAARQVVSIEYFKQNREEKAVAKDVARVACRILKGEYSKRLRRAHHNGFRGARYPRDQFGDSRGPKITHPPRNFMSTEESRWSRRLAVRVALRTQTQEKTFIYAGHNANYFQKYKIGETGIPEGPINEVHICQSQIEASEFCKTFMNENENTVGEKEFNNKVVIVIIPRKLATLRQEVRKGYENYGYSVSETTKVPERAPPKPKVAKKFIGCHEFNNSSGFQKKGSVEEPKFFIQLTSTMKNMRPSESAYGATNNSNWLYDLIEFSAINRPDDLVFVKTDKDLKLMEKLGAKDWIEESIKPFMSKSPSRAVLASMLIAKRVITRRNENDYYRMSDTERNARKIIERCPYSYFEFMPGNVGNKSKALKLSRVVKGIYAYLDRANGGSLNHKEYLKAMNDLLIAARTKFADNLSESGDMSVMFSGTRLINPDNVPYGEEDKIIKIIRLMKKEKTSNG